MTDFLRKLFSNLLNKFAKWFVFLGFKPNTITLIGVLGNFIAAFFLAAGRFFMGGILVLVFGLFDAIDGPMARLQGDENQFGAFLDSVSDRISELAIYFGILLNSINKLDFINCTLVFLATGSSLLVSYVRARAESVGIMVKIGLITRVERYLILVPTLLFKRPEIGLSIIAFFGYFTVIQRIWYVRKKFIVKE